MRRLVTPAAGATALCALFIASTARWLAVDERVPDFDTGKHLLHSFGFAEMLRDGDLLGPLQAFTDYPPLVHIVGALGAVVGGDTEAAPIMALNLVFIPLLVLSVYRTGTLLADSRIGLLAVVFTLGAPLLIGQFHDFYLESGSTALAAATIWLVIESDRFARPRWALAAGVAGGLGLLTKPVFPFFVGGFVLVALLRGGRRNWRGVAVAAAAAVVVAAPWYLAHLSDLDGSLKYAEAPPDPPRWSIKNLAWFAWVQLNWQLLVPMCALLATGTVASALQWVRTRDPRNWAPELIATLVVAYLGLTYSMGLHAIYYLLPIVPAQALLATVWLKDLRPAWFRLAAAAVAVIAAVNFWMANFVGYELLGKNGRAAIVLGKEGTGANLPRYVTLLSVGTAGPPHKGGPIPGIMRAARDDGIRAMEFDAGIDRYDFNVTGLTALARIQGIERANVPDPSQLDQRQAYITIRPPGEPALPPPCGTLRDGSGVYLILGVATKPVPEYRYCPTR